MRSSSASYATVTPTFTPTSSRPRPAGCVVRTSCTGSCSRTGTRERQDRDAWAIANDDAVLDDGSFRRPPSGSRSA